MINKIFLKDGKPLIMDLKLDKFLEILFLIQKLFYGMVLKDYFKVQYLQEDLIILFMIEYKLLKKEQYLLQEEDKQ